MHELSLIQGILQAALDSAQKAGKKRIGEIRAKVRESGHPMEAYSLQSLLDVIAKDTIADGAEMKIEVIPPTLRCGECDFTFLSQTGTLICPRCRSGKLKVLDAEEIDLECNFTE